MSYLKLLNARRKNGQQPTMKPVELTSSQKTLADRGLCIECGEHEADRNSYRCDDCQGKDTIEDIREEIGALRRQILGRPGGSE